MTPLDVDRHSFRDLWVMFGASRDRLKMEAERAVADNRDEWRRTLWIVQAVLDYGGPRDYKTYHPKDLGTLAAEVLKEKKDMTNDQIASTLRAFARSRKRKHGD